MKKKETANDKAKITTMMENNNIVVMNNYN